MASDDDSSDEIDSMRLSRVQSFKRWFSDNFTNKQHEESIEKRKQSEANGQKFKYMNDVIMMMMKKKYELTTKEQIQRVFDQFDTNGDGKLCKEEMTFVIETLLGMKLQKEEFRVFYDKLDANKDGTICCDEFCAWLSKV